MPTLHTTIAFSTTRVGAFGCAADYANVVQSRPCCKSVQRSMLRTANYLQVFWRIIRSVFVNMVSMPVGRGVGYDTVLIAPFSVRTFDFDIAIAANLFSADRLGARMTVFFQSLCPALAPILTAMSGNKARIHCNASSYRRNVRLNLFVAPTRANLNNCSCPFPHD